MAQLGDYETDIRRNYAEDCVALTGRGTFRGHAGMTRLAEMLADELPDGEWEYTTRAVDGQMAFLEWRGESESARVEDGADSFLIEHGKVVVQTIHYTVLAPDGSVLIGPDGRRSSS